MPHLFINRLRLLAPAADADPRTNFRWERANALLYKLGGLVFMVGSLLFFPQLSAWADTGAWIFFGGSLVYLVVTGHDLSEVRRNARLDRSPPRTIRMEWLAAVSFILGTLLFTAGSVFFVSWVGMLKAGAWCFVGGSLLFVVGACLDVATITRAHSIQVMQLLNYTAVSYALGSVLFTTASVPYLWELHSAGDRFVVGQYVAAQYLIGSAFFFVGGVVNYRRARLVAAEAEAAIAPDTTPTPSN